MEWVDSVELCENSSANEKSLLSVRSGGELGVGIGVIESAIWLSFTGKTLAGGKLDVRKSTPEVHRVRSGVLVDGE